MDSLLADDGVSSVRLRHREKGECACGDLIDAVEAGKIDESFAVL